jgi:hypothetical protein
MVALNVKGRQGNWTRKLLPSKGRFPKARVKERTDNILTKCDTEDRGRMMKRGEENELTKQLN